MKRYEEAVAQYLGKPFPTTPAMELGTVKHQLWAKHIMSTKTLPDELGTFKLNSPVVEQKYQKMIPLGDKYQILLRGAPDLTDETEIYEFKVGLTKPTQYVDSWQLDVYKLLIPELLRGKYICYDPYFNQTTIGIKFLTDKNAEHALENIITFGSEMIDYLESDKLLVDYKEAIA